MAEEKKENLNNKTKPGANNSEANSPAEKGKRKYVRKGGKRGGSRKNFERTKPEFDQKMLSIRRVTRVVSGGRRFSFSVAMVIGDRKGSVGIGSGKASDTSLAIEKALKSARKNMITPKLTKSMSLPFDVQAKYTSSEIMMAPKKGGGLKAGSSARIVLELLGATDISAKMLSRSKNKVNNAQATIEALKKVGFTKRKVASYSDKGRGDRKPRGNRSRGR